jgi:DNA-binding LacI/PurR family transcriptional regulator
MSDKPGLNKSNDFDFEKNPHVVLIKVSPDKEDVALVPVFAPDQKSAILAVTEELKEKGHKDAVVIMAINEDAANAIKDSIKNAKKVLEKLGLNNK